MTRVICYEISLIRFLIEKLRHSNCRVPYWRAHFVFYFVTVWLEICDLYLRTVKLVAVFRNGYHAVALLHKRPKNLWDKGFLLIIVLLNCKAIHGLTPTLLQDQGSTEITAGQRTLSDQNGDLTGQKILLASQVTFGRRWRSFLN